MNCRIRPALAWSVVWLAALATASAAAEITEVRVGRHPAFTRVVFELDAPAGYRIERRSDATGEATSILVTMEARTRPRTVSGRAGMVESVTVEEQLGRAVARIRLRKPKLRLKEMILANPPRIVLDVVHEPASAAVAKPPERGGGRAKKPAPAPQAAEPKRRASQPAPIPTPTQSGSKASAGSELGSPRSQPAPSRTEEAPAGSGTKPVETVAARVPPAKPVTPAPIAKPAPKTIAETPPRTGPSDAESRRKTTPTPRAAAKPVARPTAPSKPASPAPSGAQPTPMDFTHPSPAMLAAGAAAAVLVVGAFVLLRRRRAARRAADGEFGAGADLFPDDDESATVSALGAAGEAESGAEAGGGPMPVPGFGDAGEGGLFGDLDTSTASSPESQQPESMPAAAPGGSLFGDDEKEESNVDQMSTPMSGMDTTAGPGATPPTGDLMRMIADLERRLNLAESRLDESAEAYERLERQMAAQSEELRVQRAAIARTQRALRSLSRSEEEQATEPAIRDPR